MFGFSHLFWAAQAKNKETIWLQVIDVRMAGVDVKFEQYSLSGVEFTGL